MNTRHCRAVAVALPCALFANLALAQTATITYSLPQAIPVIGNSLLLILGVVLAFLGARWLQHRPAAGRKLSIALLSGGLAIASASTLWLSQNTQALPAAIAVLFSENDNPLEVSSFPAELTNDLDAPATLRSIDIAGCSSSAQLAGTCSVGTTLAAQGGSCLIESICSSSPAFEGEVCFASTEFSSADPWVICDINESEAWVSASTGGTYNALAICQGLGYDTVGQQGGTCGNVCGYCEGETSCSNPGSRTFDGRGGEITALNQTVQWTCVNIPE